MRDAALIKDFKAQAGAEKTLCIMNDAHPVQRVTVKARTNITEDRAFIGGFHNHAEHALILTDHEDTSIANVGLSLIRRITSNTSREFNNRAHFMDTFIARHIDTEMYARRQNRGALIAQVTEDHKQALRMDILQSLLRLDALIAQDAPFLVRIIGSSMDDDYAYEWHLDGDERTARAVRCVDDRSTLIAYDDCSYETPANICVTAGQGLYIIRGDAWHSTPSFKHERSCYTIDPIYR